MKKIKFLPIILLAALGLVACGGTPIEPTTPDVPSETPTETPTTTPSSSEEAAWIDYVNGGYCKLNHDYKGRDFYTEGIGQVKLRTAIDGDTAHFIPYNKTTSGENIKARFFGVDTPESTGKVQPWGKPASDFTKEKLKEADKNGTIVVSSPFEDYHIPAPDSTGERYVSLIWINLTKKDANFDELVLLNLWIVQEGMSWVKNVMDMPQYADTFYAAGSQAEAFEKGMFSGPDETFPDPNEYRVTSLLELKRDNEKCLNDPTYKSEFHNVRVMITGAVAGFSNHILYLQDYFNEEDSGTPGGEYASINIFTGMSPVNSKYTKRNTYIKLFGLAQYTENFGFQITDTEGRFPVVSYDDADAQVILKASENIDEHQLHVFEYTPAELNKVTEEKNYESLNCAVRLTEPVTVERVFIKSNDEITLYFKDMKFGAYITFTYTGDPDKENWIWDKEEDFVGEKFLISGVYTYHKTMSGKVVFQINPNNSNDVVWQKAA